MSKAGRKEVLTLTVAKSIIKLIERMPDAGIPVTWDNIQQHAKKTLGVSASRQNLSQKQWDGRKLISEAYDRAKSVEGGAHRDASPKYKTSSRAVLQEKILKLETKILALQEELELVRCQQFDQLDAFVTSRCNLREILAKAVP